MKLKKVHPRVGEQNFELNLFLVNVIKNESLATEILKWLLKKLRRSLAISKLVFIFVCNLQLD